MKLRRRLRALTSARLTVSLLCAMAVLLLLNVALPQQSTLGEERFARMVDGHPWIRFFLVTLGLGRMSTSPVFLSVLTLFFLNLVLVLGSRWGPTWRRVALKPRSEKGLRAWARLAEARSGPLSPSWSPGRAAKILRGFGYQVRRPGPRSLWAVKHRTAPLGFLLFHLSFLLLCAGGTLVYYTRFVGSVVLSEGQQFAGQYNDVLRQRPVGPEPELAFSLESADPRFERGDPVHLGAVFLFERSGSTLRREASVNHPARWGSTSILVNQAGLAPVLWLQDERGFTVDRVVVPAHTRGGPPTDITLGDDRTVVFIHPLDAGAPFPARGELDNTAIDLHVTRDSMVVFQGELRPGEAASFDGGRLVLEELRYWVGMHVVSERGGALLIAGFAVGIVGLVWRLLWYRREIALTWDETLFHLVGRSEYFSGRFRDELEAIRSVLERVTEEPAESAQSGANVAQA